MNGVELGTMFRALSRDNRLPYLTADSLASLWFAEAEREAAIRGRLIPDEVTISLDTPAAATLSVDSGILAAGTYSYRVSAFNAAGETLAAPKATLAVALNEGVRVSWAAMDMVSGFNIYGRTDGAEKLLVSVGQDVTEWIDDGSVAESTVDPPSSNTTADVVRINITAGRFIYPVHTAVIEIMHAYLLPIGGAPADRIHLTQRTEDGLDQIRPLWREADPEIPKDFIHDDKDIRLGTKPDVDYTMWMVVKRKPLQPITDITDPTQYPEIHEDHHYRLVDWVLHKHYSQRDADIYDPRKAKGFLQDFSDYFGERPKADQRRKSQANAPHHVKAHW